MSVSEKEREELHLLFTIISESLRKENYSKNLQKIVDIITIKFMRKNTYIYCIKMLSNNMKLS